MRSSPRPASYAPIRVPDWPDAACRRSAWPADTWMDPAGDEEREAARNVCRTCTHLAPCAEFGIRHSGMLPGIWGGLTRGDRLRLRREQRQAGQAGSAA
jgi:hypothetical protein